MKWWEGRLKRFLSGTLHGGGERRLPTASRGAEDKIGQLRKTEESMWCSSCDELSGIALRLQLRVNLYEDPMESVNRDWFL